MIKKIVFLFTVLVLHLLPVKAQVSVYHVNSATKPPAKNGVFYTLPLTKIKVEVIVKVTDHVKGPLSDLAEKYVGTKNAIKFDNTTYNIEDVHVIPVPEPDPEQVYFVEIGGKSSKKSPAINLNFNDAGFLCSTFNADNDQNKKEIETQIVFSEERKSQASELFHFQAFGNIKAKIDTIVRKVTVDTAIIQKLVFRARIAEKTDEELASEILGKIQSLRDSKLKLLTGFQEIAYQPETIKYMHLQLEKQENEYLAMFCGKTVSSYVRFTFYYTPGAEPQKDEISLFRFSENSGVSPVMSSSGEVVSLKISTAGISKVTSEFLSRQIKDDELKGFFYRIPENANVMLTLENAELLNKPIIINQFGQVRNLPSNKTKVEFYPETGGIKTIEN